MLAQSATEVNHDLNSARRLRTAGAHRQARAAYAALVGKFEHPLARLEFSRYLREQGDSDAAFDQCQRAWTSARSLASPSLETAALDELAAVNRDRGDHLRAMSAQRRSFAMKLQQLDDQPSDLRPDVNLLAMDAAALGVSDLAAQMKHARE